ncbi:MAG: sugar phosphate isomerase/epimerase [Chloroflexota bacterium]|nr:sugar phosphate isomerase/epimerase [Chloroflexota bacterium]
MTSPVGYALLPWEGASRARTERPVETMKRGLREIAAAGFDAFEVAAETTLTSYYARRVMPFAEWMPPPRTLLDIDFITRMAAVLRAAEEVGLTPTTIFCESEWINPRIADAEFDQVVVISHLMHSAGIAYLLVDGGPRRDGARHEEDIHALAHQMTAMGRECARREVQLCFHPHIDTCIETPHDIEMFFDLADAEVVGMALDTAHITAGGGDPVEFLRANVARVKYIHLKDIAMPPRPSVDFAGYARFAAFRNLGEGSVDFPAVGRVLAEAAFDGPLIAELDQTDDPAATARAARQYLRASMGV